MTGAPSTPAAPLSADAFFHTGVVVGNLEVAMREYELAFGVTWRSVSDGDVDFWTPAHSGVLHYRAAYSVQGPPYIQLEEALDERLWPAGSEGIHHLGFWSEDLDADAATLVRAGMSRTATFARDGVELANVHRAGTGAHVELVTATWRARFA